MTYEKNRRYDVVNVKCYVNELQNVSEILGWYLVDATPKCLTGRYFRLRGRGRLG
jgi:hypothetical protein